MKLISDSYLYKTADYGKRLFEYLMTAERVDKNNNSFNDIIYDVKKQANAILIKVLLSDKVVLLLDQKGVSRAFKVIYAKDIKGDKEKKKVFIDCTGVITYENGVYRCKKIGNLISYLMTAMTYVMYYNNPRIIMANATLTKSGAEAFVDMVLYVLGYLKVPVTFSDNKERMAFVLAEYYQICILGAEPGESVFNMAQKISGIKEKKTCDYLHTLFSFILTEETTFEKFLAKFAEVFLGQEEGASNPKNRTALTVDAFVQRWMYAYGPGTFLGLECFVPFAQTLTDCYCGAFLNQQNTIEKVAGSRTVTAFSNELLKVGSENG